MKVRRFMEILADGYHFLGSMESHEKGSISTSLAVVSLCWSAKHWQPIRMRHVITVPAFEIIRIPAE